MENHQDLNEARKFATDTIFVAASRLLVRLRGIITIPFLTKAYGVEGYGLFVQMGATSDLLAHLLGLRLAASCVRYLSGKRDDAEALTKGFGSLMSILVVFNVLIFLAVYIFTVLRQGALSYALFGNSGYPNFVYLTFLWVISITIFELSLSFFRALGEIKRLSMIKLSHAAINVGLIIGLCFMNYELHSVIEALISSGFVFYVAILFIVTREHGFPKPNFSGTKQFLAFSLPLIPLTLLRWIINSSDRYFITHLVDLASTGIYSVCYAVGNLISVFSFPLFFVLFPAVSKHWDDKNIDMVRNYLGYSTSIFLLFSFPAATMLYFVSYPLLSIFLPPGFTLGADLVFLIALSTILAGIFQINAYIIYLVQKTKLMLIVSFLGAGINAFCNLQLIPSIGINGAAVSSIVSYLALCSIMAFWGKREIGHVLVKTKYVVKLILASLIMACLLSLFDIRTLVDLIVYPAMGIMVFVLMLVLLRTFSKEELSLFKGILLRK